MAATVNIALDKGTDFQYVFALQANGHGLSLANSTAFASMKREYEAASNSAVFFVSSISGSNLTISMSASATANLEPGTWVYDAIVIDSSNLVTRVVEGRITVSPQVTIRPS